MPAVVDRAGEIPLDLRFLDRVGRRVGHRRAIEDRNRLEVDRPVSLRDGGDDLIGAVHLPSSAMISGVGAGVAEGDDSGVETALGEACAAGGVLSWRKSITPAAISAVAIATTPPIAATQICAEPPPPSA